MVDDAITGARQPSDLKTEATIRPSLLDDIIGQDRIKGSLKVFMAAAKSRNVAMDHGLFRGPPGLGKTTFAMAVAKELGYRVETITGPVLSPQELASRIMTHIENNRKRRVYNALKGDYESISPPNAGTGYCLFVDEIHAMPKETHELMYPLMEDFKFRGNVVPPFTLLAATTDPSKLPLPLRERFGMDYMIDYYDVKDIELIIRRAFGIMYPVVTSLSDEQQRLITSLREDIDKFEDDSPQVADFRTRIAAIEAAATGSVGIASITDEAVTSLAVRSRGTPRTAIRLMRRALDFMEVSGTFTLTLDLVRDAMMAIGVDALGMNDVDRKIVKAMTERFKRPVGLAPLATAIGEDLKNLESIHEPWLIREGFLDREQRGRTLTMKGLALSAQLIAGEIEW